jgi:hypothetical protein
MLPERLAWVAECCCAQAEPTPAAAMRCSCNACGPVSGSTHISYIMHLRFAMTRWEASEGAPMAQALLGRTCSCKHECFAP